MALESKSKIHVLEQVRMSKEQSGMEELSHMTVTSNN